MWETSKVKTSKIKSRGEAVKGDQDSSKTPCGCIVICYTSLLKTSSFEIYSRFPSLLFSIIYYLVCILRDHLFERCVLDPTH